MLLFVFLRREPSANFREVFDYKSRSRSIVREVVVVESNVARIITKWRLLEILPSFSSPSFSSLA